MAIHDQRDRELARMLVRHSIKAKAGDLVYIHAIGGDTSGLVEAIVEEILAVGAAPYWHFIVPEITRKFLINAREGSIKRLRQIELKQVEEADCYIGIRGAENIFEYADVPRKQMDMYNKLVGNPVRDKRVRETRWVVLRYPNSSMAQLAGQSRESFAEFYYRVCTLNYAAMARACRPLKQLMEKTDRVEIRGRGTDLSFSMKKIGVVPCAGEYNIPDGECFTAPVKDSVNGKVTFNTPSIWEGTPFDGISLTFKKGKIIEAQGGDKQQTTRLNEILDQDAGARYVGEFSLAFNPFILHPMRDILFDEKIAGSFHMAMGQAYKEADNGNKSGLHWDMVCIQRPEYGGGEITFDGKLIRRNGLFLPKNLQALNPQAFGGGKKTVRRTARK